jgi:hypothetical protein
MGRSLFYVGDGAGHFQNAVVNARLAESWRLQLRGTPYNS